MSEKVAVIAVHGVAYHEPGASANEVSELLLGLPPEDGRAKYGSFAAETVHIPLHPLDVLRPVPPPQAGGIFERISDRFRERIVYLTRAWLREGGTRQLGGEKPGEVAANDFMRLTLQEYRGSDGPVNKPKDQRDDTAYRTTRMAGKRTWKDNFGADHAIGVDVYEMYWADLSRPKQSILSFFQALYQLLFHLASLSRLAVSTSYENRDDLLWRKLTGTQGWAVRMLTLPIPILNVLLLISLLGAVPRLVTSDSTASIAAICGAAFMGLLIYAVFARKLPATRRPWTWVLFPLAFMLPLAVIAALLVCFSHVSPQAVLSLEGLLLGSVVLYLSVRSYDEVRDGAWESALILWALWIIPFAALLLGDPTAKVDQITLWMMQIVLAALRLSWVLLFGCALLAFVFGGRSWRKIRKEEKKKKTGGDPNRCARARAAVRTSRLALALPTMGVLVVTLALFSTLFVKGTGNQQSSFSLARELFGKKISEPLTPDGHRVIGIPVSGYFLGLFILDKNGVRPFVNESLYLPCMTPNQYFKGILVWSATRAFPIILGLLFWGLLLMALWLIPSIYSEMQPPRRSDNPTSKRMGSWLSRGLDVSKMSTLLIWVAAFAVPAILVGMEWLVGSSALKTVFKKHFPDFYYMQLAKWIHFVSTWLTNLTTTILLSIGALAGSLALLAYLAKSGSSVLGIILDVDNYLRTSPKGATPRARIMERYVSLLGYLSDYKDPVDGKGYDRIVIVAHSLGALISVDLLRFLKVQFGSPTIELRLFTMGNPLRQLLNRFFPYLYQWVHPIPDNSLSPLPCVAQDRPVPFIDPGESPDPNLLGVKKWVSAYRSGDYVGRSVWLNEWYYREDPAQPGDVYVAKENPPGGREEMCIGAGAHQHYWDQSAPDIAEKLDELIQY
jgi:hypothetical protein